MDKILSYAKLRFRDHRKGARTRNIPFQLTFEEWYNWWLAQGEDRNIPRVNDSTTLCMCRIGDQGPYSINNIYCATRRQNTIDGHKNNPNISGRYRKKMRTPSGTFQSKIEAAKALKVHTTTLSKWLISKPTEYYYL
jgi:hypothetical protein